MSSCPPGDHRHGADHLRHGHTGARAPRDGGGGGRGPEAAAPRRGQAPHHGHGGHLQCPGGDEEPDPPRRPPGGVAEVEAGGGVAALTNPLLGGDEDYRFYCTIHAARDISHLNDCRLLGTFQNGRF